MVKILTYLLLSFSITSLWITPLRRIWSAFLFGAIIFGLLSDRINYIGVAITLIFALLVYVSYSKTISKILRIASILLCFAVAFGLFYHYLPGFNNWQVLSQFRFSPDSVPYSLYLNFDKTIIGLFILAFGFPVLADFKKKWAAMLKMAIPTVIIGLITVTLLSFAVGYIRFDPKLPKVTFIWALANLFFVCITEEAIFRGIIQKNLAQKLATYKYGKYLALILASILFGLAHFWGGATYVLLAAVAGLFYGYLYMRTERIESSILFHFILNLIHFTMFSYPALQQ